MQLLSRNKVFSITNLQFHVHLRSHFKKYSLRKYWVLHTIRVLSAHTIIVKSTTLSQNSPLLAPVTDKVNNVWKKLKSQAFNYSFRNKWITSVVCSHTTQTLTGICRWSWAIKYTFEVVTFVKQTYSIADTQISPHCTDT